MKIKSEIESLLQEANAIVKRWRLRVNSILDIKSGERATHSFAFSMLSSLSSVLDRLTFVCVFAEIETDVRD